MKWIREVDGIQETLTLVILASPGPRRLAVRIDVEGDDPRHVDMDGQPIDVGEEVETPAEPTSYDSWEERTVALAADEWIERAFDAERVEDDEEDGD